MTWNPLTSSEEDSAPDSTPESNDRDGLTPPDVTITQKHADDGDIFVINESGVEMKEEPTYEMAASYARDTFGEDVAISLDAAPSDTDTSDLSN